MPLSSNYSSARQRNCWTKPATTRTAGSPEKRLRREAWTSALSSASVLHSFYSQHALLEWAVSPFTLQSPEDTQGTGVEGVKIMKAIKATGDSFKLLLVGQNTHVKVHINFLPHSRSFADIDNSLRMKLTAAALIYAIEL